VADQTLNVKLTGDASDLIAATADASRGLEDLKGDIAKVDAEEIEVTPQLELSRIRRDAANLNRVLDGIERRKANPDVGMDLEQLLRDEARVRKQLDALDKREVEITADLDAEPALTGMDRVSQSLGDLSSGFGGGLGLGAASKGLDLVGKSGWAAAAGIGGAAIAAGGASIALGDMAADVETSVTQLDALSQGHGEEMFADLQKWAAETPFAIEDAVGATRRLTAAGVEIQDVNDYLTDLGEVASATGTPLEQIATVFAQMEGKGKATFEEMQQLAEAGLPVWQTLADKMGLSVAEVQDLATQGKLGADAIDLLRESMAETFTGTMAKQAATYNGQMSTFKDSVSQTGQTLGTLFLPMMTDGIEALNDLASGALWAAQKFGDLDEKVKEISPGGAGIFEGLTKGGAIGLTLTAFDKLGIGAEDAGDATADGAATAASGIDQLVTSVQSGLQDAAAEAEAYKERVEAAFAGGVDIRTRVNFLISADDLHDAILQATHGADAVRLPANLDVKGISGLSAEQKTVVGDLSSFVQQGIEEGARRAEVNPDFDVEAWNARIYAETRELAIKAGIDPTNVDRFLARILGLKPTIDVEADTDPAWNDVQRFVLGKAEKTVPVEGNTDPAENDVASFVQRKTGKTIYVEADTAAAAAEIAQLTVQRTVDVVANFVGRALGGGNGNGGSSGRSATGSTTPQLLAASRAMGDDPSFYGPTARNRRRPYDAPPPARQLRPKSTPIAVYLDGAQIADQLSLRTDRLATIGSVRREA
jgi:tape measure domain-containing protein